MMEEKEMRKARNEFSKNQAESVINRYNQRLVTILLDNYVPGLETVVFEGINGCGKDYLYNKLNDKFKEMLGIDLPLYSSKPPLEDLKKLESFLKITEEGLTPKEVINLATCFLNRMEGVTADIAMSIKDNPEWVKKTFDKAQFNRKEIVEGYIESKPTTKYVGVMRWTLSNYIYCIQALLGTKEINRLLDRYFQEYNGNEGFSCYCLESLNVVEWDSLPQPMFLYEIASNPKVVEFTRLWSQHVSSRKHSPLRYTSLAPMDNLVYISCPPSLAEKRIGERDKVDISTDSHKTNSLRFTFLLYNALYYCVFYQGSDDEYLEGSNELSDSIKDQIRTILYKKERVRYSEGMRGYKYQLTEFIQLLKAMFDVNNINLIYVSADLMDIESMVDYIFDKIVYKERLDESYRDTLGTEMHPSMVRGRV